MVVFNPFPEKASRIFFQTLGDQDYVTTWDEVIQRLTQWHPDGARVIVYPDLTMQYLLTDG